MTDAHTDIADIAALWVARMDGEAWNSEREAELQAWLDRDRRHPGALLAAQATWLALDRMRTEESAAPVPPRLWLRRRGLLAGAGAALAASVAGGLFLMDDSIRYTTRTGEIRRVPLADGSLAAINTASSVHIRLGAAQRDVELERGEAWFQVAKDPRRPFVVAAGRIRARAVGTAFSVRRYDNGAEILVSEGVVQGWASGAEGARIQLVAGERAFIAEDAAIRRLDGRPSAVDRALAWRAGKIDLAGTPLSAAIAEFNRYNEVQLVLDDPALGKEQLDGVFGTDDPAGFATAVKTLLDVPIDAARKGEIHIGMHKN